jgi:predicted dehydrogenase
MSDGAVSVRVGMVGLGLASNAHLKGYASHPRAQVVAVCDLDGARAQRFVESHAIPKVYNSYDKMLADPDVNTVDIATPTFLHAPMTVQAAEAGKHIHCEKPFCRSVAEGLRACAAARHNEVKLVVGESYVFNTSHMMARHLIEAGEIGQPLQVRQRHGAWLARPTPRIDTGPQDRSWRVDPERSGGGDYPWIYDHAVHFFAAAEYFALDAAIDQVYAVTSAGASTSPRQGAEHDPYRLAAQDIPIIAWTYADGVSQGVWMRAERLNGKYDVMRGFSTTIHGERGMIEVLGEGGHNLVWEGRQQHLVLHREGQETRTWRFDEGGDDVWQSDVCYYSQAHINQVHHLIDSIVSGSEPRYTGEDGVRAVRCTLAVIRSAREGRPVRVQEVEPEFVAYARS